MKFVVDRDLELYIGGGDAIGPGRQRGGEDLRDLVIGELMDLGAVGEKERKALRAELSAVQRAAGVKYRNRRRPMRLTGVSALVLDDDAVSRKVLAAALQREGCAVKSVGDIDEAFQWLSKSPPDVVIVDISLGGTVDGFAVCEMIHASPPLQATPVIMVTGYPQVNPQERAEKTGARAYFEKPVKPLKLRESVLKFIGRDLR
ncbi:response regulator [Paraburkholderia lycopersici]|nr:response regulator [Paraburkholderia lycopersici]